MSDKFQYRYRIPSARADWWDYGWNAAYFVTICTAHRDHYFGKIINGNDVQPGCYVETGHCPVSTHPDTNFDNSTPKPETPGELRYRNQGKDTLSSIIGSYKSIVTKQAHRIHADFEWQERFHDHIIRDREEFYQIANYIGNNVDNWCDDKFYS